MELDEFEVAHVAACAVGNGHAVAGRDGRIRGLAKDLAGPAGGQDDRVRPDEGDAVSLRPDGGAQARVLEREQVERERVLDRAHVPAVCDLADQGLLDLEAGRVAAGVDDSRASVPALAGEGQPPVFHVERRAPGDELGDEAGRLADDRADDLGIAQAAADRDRVLRVLLGRISVSEHGCDPALGLPGVALLQFVLRDDDDACVSRGLDGGAQTGDAGPDHEQVGEHVRHGRAVERDKIARCIRRLAGRGCHQQNS